MQLNYLIRFCNLVAFGRLWFLEHSKAFINKGSRQLVKKVIVFASYSLIIIIIF